MADKGSKLPPQINLDAKWDACQDLCVRRVFYSSVAGAAAGLLLFRSPVKRWATVAFAAGIGIGSAYTDCSQIMSGTCHRRWPLKNKHHEHHHHHHDHHQNPAPLAPSAPPAPPAPPAPSAPEAKVVNEE